MPAFWITVSPVCSEERRKSQISFLALSAPLQMNDFGGTLRDLEKSCGRLSKNLPPLLSEKLCATNRALESNFFMKNSAFYFHLSLCLVFLFFFFSYLNMSQVYNLQVFFLIQWVFSFSFFSFFFFPVWKRVYRPPRNSGSTAEKRGRD